MHAHSVELNFVVHGTRDLEYLRGLNLERDWQEFTDGETCWICETYHVLKRLGLPVSLSDRFDQDAINFAHYNAICALRPDPSVFLVVCRADYPPCCWAQAEIVQNMEQERIERSVWLPHWPLPSILPRDAKRKGVECIGLLGIPQHIAGGKKFWTQLASERGMRCEWLERDNCNDFRELDVLVAVRRFDNSEWMNRPPWKLVNAWLGRVPLIAGNDSAYSQVGTPGRNYLVATSPGAAVEALCNLAQDQSFYQGIVRCGAEEGEKYAHAAIAERWVEALEHRIFPLFDEWQRRGTRGRMRANAAVVAWRMERSGRGVAGKALRALRRHMRS